MNIENIFFLSLLSVGAVAQTGYFSSDELIVNRKSCDSPQKTRQVVVQLDDDAENADWIMRRVDSSAAASCPVRPTLGKTIIQSKRSPNAFRLSDLVLTIDLENQFLIDGTDACTKKGIRGKGLLCLYAKDQEEGRINLVAETGFRLYTEVRPAPSGWIAPKTPDELALLRAVENSDVDVARELLSKGTNVEAGGLLCSASMQGNLPMVRLLVDYSASLVGVTGSKEHEIYPLDCAAYSGKLEIMRFLLDLGANPNGAGGRIMSNVAIFSHPNNALKIQKLLTDYSAPKDNVD